jgi:phage tail P2-like protein
MTASLLPPRRGAAEVALADLSPEVGALPAPLAALWDPWTCPAALLPWLAWALDVEDWEPSWPEATRRRVIAEAIPIHRKRGTRAGVERALAAAGLGRSRIVERFGLQVHDGTLARDGAAARAPGDHWAEYRVTLERPLTIDQGRQARAIITRAAPARAHLKLLDFTGVPQVHDATVPRTGIFTRGYL